MTLCMSYPHCGGVFNEFSINGCPDCTGGVYAEKPVGHFSGEGRGHVSTMKRAKVIIGPLTLEQLGNVRYFLSRDYLLSNYGGPRWYMYKGRGLIYAVEKLHKLRLEQFKDIGCPIFLRK